MEHGLPSTCSRGRGVDVDVVGLADFLGGNGLRSLFGRFEAHRVPQGRHPRAWRSVAGAVALCAGLLALAAGGIGGDDPVWIRVWPVVLSLGGAGLVIRRSGR